MPFFNREIRYTQLNDTTSDNGSSEKTSALDDDANLQPNYRRSKRIWLVHALLGVIWFLGFSALFYQSYRTEETNPDASSPLLEQLSYSTKTFATGFGTDRTKYQGAPDSHNGAEWNSLTNIGIVALTAKEQAALHDKSAIFESTQDDGSTYLGAVEVFHQLHCLDMLRLEVYGNLTAWLQEHHSHKDKTEHLDHCIDYLRQSLMCRPSIEILPFGMDEAAHSFRPKFDGTHTCADFESVRKWAVERQAGSLTPQ